MIDVPSGYYQISQVSPPGVTETKKWDIFSGETAGMYIHFEARMLSGTAPVPAGNAPWPIFTIQMSTPPGDSCGFSIDALRGGNIYLPCQKVTFGCTIASPMTGGRDVAFSWTASEASGGMRTNATLSPRRRIAVAAAGASSIFDLPPICSKVTLVGAPATGGVITFFTGDLATPCAIMTEPKDVSIPGDATHFQLSNPTATPLVLTPVFRLGI